MCGIVGSIGLKDESIIEKMLLHQKMRGPDGSYWKYVDKEKNVILGHNRLAILDLSEKGNQPMESDRWAITYVGEIYNHMELRQKLGPMHWESHCDTLTLLNCIEHKGIEWTLDNIDGMFAFTAYDRYDKKMYLAVDPMGIKPLYFVSNNEHFVFASSPGALTHLRDKWPLNLDALNDYLVLGATRNSLFGEINKLMPGTLLVIDNKDNMIVVDYTFGRKPLNQTETELLDTVRRSIFSVKMADVPVYMFLSGGVDSSVVASQCHGMPAVHLASPEERYAQQVAEKYNNKLNVVHPADYNARECLEDYALQSGDCSMAAIIPYIVSKEVSKLAKVAISSNGADELFFGYNRIEPYSASRDQIEHIFRSYFSPVNWLCKDPGEGLWNSRKIELETYVQFDLNKTLDFASMCHGLEVRVPYLNRSVVEAALSIGYDQHVKNGVRKSILKDYLLSEGFSKDFVHRPKLGFSLFHEPAGYEQLKEDGVKFLKEQFGIDPKFTGQFKGRDERYFAASAAAFLCWYNVWKEKLY